MDTALVITLIVGTLLVLGLSGYALHLWRKVWQQQERLESYQREVSDKLAGDLKILCQSLLDGQMPWVEGCIRIKVLLEHYDYELSHEEEYAVLQEVFVATEDIPTHENWKALDRNQRLKHEETFASLEQQYQPASLIAVRRLQTYLAERH